MRVSVEMIVQSTNRAARFCPRDARNAKQVWLDPWSSPQTSKGKTTPSFRLQKCNSKNSLCSCQNCIITPCESPVKKNIMSFFKILRK